MMLRPSNIYLLCCIAVSSTGLISMLVPIYDAFSTDPPRRPRPLCRRRVNIHQPAGLFCLSSSSSSDEEGAPLDNDADDADGGRHVDTEDLHRIAYNTAFHQADVKIVTNRTEQTQSSSADPVVWSVAYYKILQQQMMRGSDKDDDIDDNDDGRSPTTMLRHYFTELLQNYHAMINNPYNDDIADIKLVASFSSSSTFSSSSSLLLDHEGTIELRLPDVLFTDTTTITTASSTTTKFDTFLEELEARKTKVYTALVVEEAITTANDRIKSNQK